MESTPAKTTPKEQSILRENQWKRDVVRLIRRAEIARQLKSSLPLEEIVGTVKEHEKNLKINDMVDSLVSNEIIINHKVEFVMEELQKEVVGKEKGISALILMGSSVHGGGIIREISSNYYESDLDWGLITSKPIKDNVAYRIKERNEHKIRIFGEKVGINNFHSCGVYSPSNTYLRTEQLENIKEASLLLNEIHKENTWGPLNRALLYFLPSFPANVNEINRKLILDALSIMSKKNKHVWNKVISQMIEGWKSNHRIREKHFTRTGKKRDRDILFDASWLSATVMIRAMETLLTSTGEK